MFKISLQQRGLQIFLDNIFLEPSGISGDIGVAPMSHIFRELCYGTKLSLKRNNNYVYKEKIENDISGKSNSDLSSSSNGTDHVKSIGSSHFSDEPPSESYLKTQRITITNPQNSEIPAKWPLLLNFSHLNSLLTSLGNLDSKSNYKLPNSAPKWLFNNIRNNMNLSLTTPIQQIVINIIILGHTGSVVRI